MAGNKALSDKGGVFYLHSQRENTIFKMTPLAQIKPRECHKF